jgi:hypothetical protein
MSQIPVCTCLRFHDSGSHKLCMVCLGLRRPQPVCDCDKQEARVAHDEQTCHACGGVNVTLQQGQHEGVEWMDRGGREVRIIELAGDLLDRAAVTADPDEARALTRRATFLLRAYRRSMPVVRPTPWTAEEEGDVAADEARIDRRAA